MGSINPFDPETQTVAAVAWAEQLDAGVKERAQTMFEEFLHENGSCTAELNDNAVAWLDIAMEHGAVAMGMELLRLDRLKEN